VFWLMDFATILNKKIVLVNEWKHIKVGHYHSISNVFFINVFPFFLRLCLFVSLHNFTVYSHRPRFFCGRVSENYRPLLFLPEFQHRKFDVKMRVPEQNVIVFWNSHTKEPWGMAIYYEILKGNEQV
jgi:hypothetical protein